jgi:hypothetical protein
MGTIKAVIIILRRERNMPERKRHCHLGVLEKAWGRI